jgi:hypothetical protein
MSGSGSSRTTSMSNVVCVLGCGPAGLFAAHAIKMAGGEPVIMSKKVKSVIAGAQYLQRPIPEICPPCQDGLIYTYLRGTKEGYAERVYGDPSIGTSWPELPPEPAPAWNLRLAYDFAWAKYSDQVVDIAIGPDDVDDLTANFPTVISTIPAYALCSNPNHHFDKMRIAHWSRSIESGVGHNYVIYNGGPGGGGWYRCARIFGVESTEALNIVGYHPEGPKWEWGWKILGNNCDCHPNLVRTGRLGTWRRGVLTHHAFEHATAAYMERLAL